MLETFRRWVSSKGAGRYPDIARWAETQRAQFRARTEGDGLIVECTAPDDAWRLEWGPSRRPYIPGFEMRLRTTVGDGDTMHLLVLSRELMHALEADIFQQYTEDLQTRADTATPDEMRWLVLYPKLTAAELGPLREHFGAVGSPQAALVQWFRGELPAALAAAASSADGPVPLVLVVQRGRLTLRAPLAAPTVAVFESALALMRVAAREARSLASRPAA